MSNILDKINKPSDLNSLNYNELNELCDELREYVLEVTSKNGGHLGSNLGVVELTVALHRVFDSPKDKIIFDVGHQSYIHKILTGRKESFKTLRQFGGISGFPKRSESEHDMFDTGHSSNSISAAFGMAKARDIKNEDYSVICVIGDGAMTGGMTYEALNHAGDFPTNLIVILNDNEMSISKNVGGMRNYLSKLRTEPAYFKLKEEIEIILNKIPLIGKPFFILLEKLRDFMKYVFVPGVFFEELGFKYLGPIDGHDIKNLESILNRAKEYNGYPVLIHVYTKKGKGYPIAECNPDRFHGVSAFDIDTGEKLNKSNVITYSKTFGNKLIELAKKDKRIVGVTAAMPDGTGLTDFSKVFCDRFFDVGIAEQHAVSFCAGLAVGGQRPFFAVYSTFLQRAYDQVLIDICMQNLPVVFAIDRAGIVGDDGETHHGVFDISYLRHMPNLTIMSPKDKTELEQMLEFTLELKGPCAIRYPRGEAIDLNKASSKIEYGKAELLIEGTDGVIIAEGKMVNTAREVCSMLNKNNINISVINMRFIKPIDEDMLIDISKKHNKIYIIEDNVLLGGLGSAILETFNKYKIEKSPKLFAFDDSFIPHGDTKTLYKFLSMDSISIYEYIKSEIEGKINE